MKLTTNEILDALKAYKDGVHGPLGSLETSVFYRLQKKYITPLEALQSLDALQKVKK